MPKSITKHGNTKFNFIDRSCTITCLENHQFPDGSAIANVFCKEGEWTPARPDWSSIPDCKGNIVYLA